MMNIFDVAVNKVFAEICEFKIAERRSLQFWELNIFEVAVKKVFAEIYKFKMAQRRYRIRKVILNKFFSNS